jgi:hypothetical protein
LDAQPHGHQEKAGLFAHCPHPPRLAADWIREIVVICAASRHRFPKTVADRHDLLLLGVLHVGRQWQPLRVVCLDSIEILIDEAFQAGTIAVRGNGPNWNLL